MRSFGRLEQATAVMTLVVLGTCPLQADGAADDAAVWQRLDRTKDDQLDGNELDGGWVRFDTSGDKEVTKAEFMAGRAKERTKGTPSAEERFKQLDRSGNGYLSGNEIDETSRRYDVNKDNTVMLEEFVAGYTGQAPKPTTKAPHPAPPKQRPPAPPKQTPPAPPAAVAGGLPMGSYKCFGLVGRTYSARGTLVIIDGTRYGHGSDGSGGGNYVFDAATKKIRFTSGLFADPNKVSAATQISLTQINMRTGKRGFYGWDCKK